MGNVTHVSSPKEINIASNLSSSRAKVFLESRFYIRDALSKLFDVNPLEIPLRANPGEPPTLPKGMGGSPGFALKGCKSINTSKSW